MLVYKKQLLILTVIVTVLVLALFVVYLFSQKLEIMRQTPARELEKSQPTPEEILESLTAPETNPEPISEELLQSLSAPADSNPEPVPQEVLDSLTAPTPSNWVIR